jgi:hypothetical protein
MGNSLLSGCRFTYRGTAATPFSADVASLTPLHVASLCGRSLSAQTPQMYRAPPRTSRLLLRDPDTRCTGHPPGGADCYSGTRTPDKGPTFSFLGVWEKVPKGVHRRISGVMGRATVVPNTLRAGLKGSRDLFRQGSVKTARRCGTSEITITFFSEPPKQVVRESGLSPGGASGA